MKLFISWSGDTSHAVANALRGWIPEVVQAVEPWLSSEDIDKGARWSEEIAGSLEATDQGLVVVTRANQAKPWLNFEAGALAKQHSTARVRTLLVDLTSVDVTGPLASFQGTRADSEDDMLKLIQSLNAACDTPLPVLTIERVFKRAWPDFLSDLKAAPAAETKTPTRSVPEMVEEVLDRVRGIERRLRGDESDFANSNLFGDAGAIAPVVAGTKRGPTGLTKQALLALVQKLRPGVFVQHPSFGIGEVISPPNEKNVVIVNFVGLPEGHQAKRLLVQYANIKVVDNPQSYEEPPF